MLICFWASFVLTDFTIPLDEIFVIDVMSSVNIPSRTAWIGVQKDGLRSMGELYIYNHQTNKAGKVLDGRLKISVDSVLIPTASGLALINCAARDLYYLTNDGGFLEKVPLENFTGFQSDYLVLKGLPFEGKTGITFRELGDVNRLFLAELDLRNKSFNIIHALEDAPEPGFWVWGGKQWLFLNQWNGAVDLLDEYFETMKTIIPKREPKLLVKNEQVAKLLIKQGASPYALLMEGPFQNGPSLKFWNFTYQEDKQKPNISQVLIQGSTARMSRVDALTLADIGDKQLIYERSGNGFSLRTVNDTRSKN